MSVRGGPAGTGRRRPSISDVAQAAGVSPAAVSKVIRNAYGVSPGMRERVETAIQQLDYRPSVAARAMRGSSFTIGFELPHLGNEFFTQITQGAANALSGSGYQLLISPGMKHDDGSAVLEGMVDRQVNGIIAISSEVTVPWLEGISRSVPLVLLGRHERSQLFDSVTGNDVSGANLAMDHLLTLGHRRIAHLTLVPPTEGAPHAARLAVYRTRMEQAGCEPDVVYVDTDQDTYAAARAVLQRDLPPTAIFAGHDALAITILGAVADLGLSADEVSVIGYDNVSLADHPRVSLTTVDQLGVEMGSKAAELLLERIRDGRSESRHCQIEPRLQVRGSTKPYLGV